MRKVCIFEFSISSYPRFFELGIPFIRFSTFRSIQRPFFIQSRNIIPATKFATLKSVRIYPELASNRNWRKSNISPSFKNSKNHFSLLDLQFFMKIHSYRWNFHDVEVSIVGMQPNSFFSSPRLMIYIKNLIVTIKRSIFAARKMYRLEKFG